MRWLIPAAFLLAGLAHGQTRPLAKLRVSDNGRFLVTADGRPRRRVNWTRRSRWQ